MMHAAVEAHPGRKLHVGRLILFSVLSGIGLAGCCGMLGGDGGGKHHCWAAVDWRGHRQAAAGTNANADKAKADAQQGMCMWHCEIADPNVVQALEDYRKSPKGKGSRAGRSFDIGQDPKAKGYHERCVLNCAAAVQSGEAKTKFECRKRSSKTCSVELDYHGKKHKAEAKGGEGELEAWRLACRSYCKKDDPGVAKAYDEWAKSPQGKKVKTPRAKALESERPSDEVNACMGSCVADILFAKASVSVTCK